jgi:hypothetical protein
MNSRVVTIALALGAFLVNHPVSAQRSSNPLVDLWSQGKTAFGVFVPNEAAPAPNAAGRGGAAGAQPGGAAGRGAPGAAPGPGRGELGRGARPKPVYTQAGGEKLGANALYDYVFLNLEGGYDSAAVRGISDGLKKSASGNRRVALIVRVPAFHEDAAAGRAHLREVFASGADGITFPHVESVGEGKQILAAAQAEKINVWSPGNAKGDKILMMMLEDPAAVAQAAEFANLKGYSLLACGIGSLRGALKGDTAGAEAGVQKVLAETKRAKLVNMLTATTQDVEQRVKEGFLGILVQGANQDEAIKTGRAAAKR